MLYYFQHSLIEIIIKNGSEKDADDYQAWLI